MDSSLEEEMASVEDEFSEAADFVQSNAGKSDSGSSTVFDDKVALQLYGLYKRATIGPCNEPQPSIFNFKAKTKWAAWKSMSGLDKEAAMKEYVELVKTNFDWSPSFADRNESSPSANKEKGGVSMGNAVSSLKAPEEEPDNETDNPVFAFCKDNDLAQLKKWAKQVESVDVQDSDGLTPLHWCVDRGYLEACRLLLQNGANPSVQDNEGSSSVDYAETCEHTEILELLKQYL